MKSNIRLWASVGLLWSLGATALANSQDPVLTEKSKEVVTVDLGGLPLSLPAELKERAVPQKISAYQTDLDIGAVEIAYAVKDEKTGESSVVKGWLLVDGGSKSCDVEKKMETMRANFRNPGARAKIQKVANENFDGYIVRLEQAVNGKFKGIFLEAYNRKSSQCFTISIAVEDFEGFSKSQIRTSLLPLTEAVQASFIAYAKNGAAQ